MTKKGEKKNAKLVKDWNEWISKAPKIEGISVIKGKEHIMSALKNNHGKGWKRESARHALARKGIKTSLPEYKGTPIYVEPIPTQIENDYLESYHYDIWSITDEGVRETYKAKHPELSEDEIREMNPTDLREELVDLEEKKVSQGLLSSKDMKDGIASIKAAWGWKRGMEAP